MRQRVKENENQHRKRGACRRTDLYQLGTSGVCQPGPSCTAMSCYMQTFANHSSVIACVYTKNESDYVSRITASMSQPEIDYSMVPCRQMLPRDH